MARSNINSVTSFPSSTWERGDIAASGLQLLRLERLNRGELKVKYIHDL